MPRYLLIAYFSVLCLLAAAPAPAAPASAPPSVYGGILSFGEIHGPLDSEEFSWTVTLSDEQELVYVDEQEAAIYYTDNHQLAGIITPTPAHDAVGSTVPTSLRVSEGDIVTLIVHHRAGNPAASGAPFVYPISEGQGWEGGFHTEVVIGPPDESELREERERIAREEWEAAQRAAAQQAAVKTCRVPWLTDASLKASRRRLTAADCGVGKVTKRKGVAAKSGHVVGQHPRPGTVLAPGAPVALTLGR
jgi:hypothetical protein